MTKKSEFIESDIDNTIKEIGRKVRALRKEITSNYETFATDNNINKVTLQRIETGENYNMKNFLIVLNALNCSIVEFFEDFK